MEWSTGIISHPLKVRIGIINIFYPRLFNDIDIRATVITNIVFDIIVVEDTDGHSYRSARQCILA